MAIRQGQDTIDPAATLPEPGGGRFRNTAPGAARLPHIEFPVAGHYRA